MTELVRNGIFVSPLYHGTTTLFVESIKKYGLGGMDIVKEWNLVKVYGELFNLAEEK